KPLAAACQPLGETRRQVQAVRMLERQNRRFAFFVIGEDGAGANERRWTRQTGAAPCARAGIESEGQPAAIAGRTIEKGDATPAGRTKAPARTQRFATANTERWKQKIQQ